MPSISVDWADDRADEALDRARDRELYEEQERLRRYRERNPIRTEHIYPPIPERCWDWCAYRDPEPGHPCGYGRTKDEAIAALLAQEDEHEPLSERDAATAEQRDEQAAQRDPRDWK